VGCIREDKIREGKSPVGCIRREYKRSTGTIVVIVPGLALRLDLTGVGLNSSSSLSSLRSIAKSSPSSLSSISSKAPSSSLSLSERATALFETTLFALVFLTGVGEPSPPLKSISSSSDSDSDSTTAFFFDFFAAVFFFGAETTATSQQPRHNQNNTYVRQ